MIYVLSGGGGSGKLSLVTIEVSDWYQQTPANEEHWYACDVACSSAGKTAVVTAANAETYDWLMENAYYELAITSTGFSLQAKEVPTTSLQIFYELKSGGAG